MVLILNGCESSGLCKCPKDRLFKCCKDELFKCPKDGFVSFDQLAASRLKSCASCNFNSFEKGGTSESGLAGTCRDCAL